MAAAGDSKTNNLLLALRHPLRRQILHLLSGKEPRSPRELADTLGQPLSNVSYHVRILADCDAVKLVRTRQVRGSTQHFYRSSVKPDWARSVLRSTRRPRQRRAGKKKP
jgi:DNA-binding transcriptional ArsR family regulator